MSVTHFDIELTNLCNAVCIMCPRERLNRPLGIMSEETMDVIIQKAVIYGVKNFVFSGFGEPCINKNIGLFIGKIKEESDIKIELNTNGGLLTQARIDCLLDKGLDVINFNINSTNSNDYSRMTKGIDFDNLLAKIDYLVQSKPKKQPLIKIRVQAALVKNDAVDDFTSFWFRRGINEVVIHPCNNRAGYLQSNGLSADRISANPFSGRYCRMILFVGWNGDVFPCSHDLEGLYKFGHITEMKESWLVKEKVKLCDSCNLTNLENIVNDGFR